MHCKARVEPVTHPLLSLMQRWDINVMIKCLLRLQSKVVQSLHGFGRILQVIAGTDKVTQEASALLSEPLSALIYSSNDAVVGFTG